MLKAIRLVNSHIFNDDKTFECVSTLRDMSCHWIGDFFLDFMAFLSMYVLFSWVFLVLCSACAFSWAATIKFPSEEQESFHSHFGLCRPFNRFFKPN